jgi:predicted nucleic acid-binding protein
VGGQPTHVLDASALITYLKAEPGNQRLADLLADDINILTIHIMNLCEVHCCYYRTDGQAQAQVAWEQAATILQICTPIDEAFIKLVGRWKAVQGLPMLDAVAAATAEKYACPLLTTDHNHFEPVVAMGLITVEFLR